MSGSTSGATTALIAGGFAVVGFIAAGWQNGRTIRANQQSAREQRLWDKKTALYEAISTAMKAAELTRYEIRSKLTPMYRSKRSAVPSMSSSQRFGFTPAKTAGTSSMS